MIGAKTAELIAVRRADSGGPKGAVVIVWRLGEKIILTINGKNYRNARRRSYCYY